MKEFSVFVITAAACVFFLTGCGAASDSTSSVEPDAPHTESTAQPTATPIITPAPDAESSEAVEKSLFDPASADYTGSVVEMTDTGFTLSPTVVERLGANASVGVMAEAGASSWFSVMCTDDTRYIAIYADGNGSSVRGRVPPIWCRQRPLCISPASIRTAVSRRIPLPF